MNRKRYVVEGTWSGYRSEQRRVCHRTVEGEKFAKRVREIGTIGYTDGTTLDLVVREAKPREKITEMHGYDSLIRDCIETGRKGFISVESLQRAEGSDTE